MPWHTDLNEVFRSLRGRQRELSWLLTDVECNAILPGEISADPPAWWLSGRELSDFVEASRIQFNWAVASGFRVPLATGDRLLHYPFADGNQALWDEQVLVQHPSAEVEIVCWDSSATLLISREPSFVEDFRLYFHEAIDLEDHNRAVRRGSRR